MHLERPQEISPTFLSRAMSQKLLRRMQQMAKQARGRYEPVSTVYGFRNCHASTGCNRATIVVQISGKWQSVLRKFALRNFCPQSIGLCQGNVSRRAVRTNEGHVLYSCKATWVARNSLGELSQSCVGCNEMHAGWLSIECGLALRFLRRLPSVVGVRIALLRDVVQRQIAAVRNKLRAILSPAENHFFTFTEYKIKKASGSAATCCMSLRLPCVVASAPK